MNSWGAVMKSYVVALEIGGEQGSPYMAYINRQVIKAEDRKQAKRIYDVKNKCEYYYGVVIGEKLEDGRFVIDEGFLNIDL